MHISVAVLWVGGGKPSFSDGWTIVGALVVAATLSALLVGPTVRGRLQTA